MNFVDQKIFIALINANKRWTNFFLIAIIFFNYIRLKKMLLNIMTMPTCKQIISPLKSYVRTHGCQTEHPCFDFSLYFNFSELKTIRLWNWQYSAFKSDFWFKFYNPKKHTHRLVLHSPEFHKNPISHLTNHLGMLISN